MTAAKHSTIPAIEFVGTAINHRSKGVASSIMKYIFDNTEYIKYVLEVADTNYNAIRLYEKLGFKEFLRIKQKHSKHSGVNYLVYMECYKH